MKTAESLPQDYLDRFSGVGRLYGEVALERLFAAHVCIIGLGGVGSWTAEALARSGIGELTLIDLDDVCITNVNRQLPAIEGAIGKPKVEVIADRLRAINPTIRVCREKAFFTDSTAEELLSRPYDCVVDAIDGLDHKNLLIGECKKRSHSIVVVGGAGGRRNPAAIRADDLAFATNNRLLKMLRKKLRADYGFPMQPTRLPFGVPCVFSVEDPVYPWSDGSVCQKPEPDSPLRLNCASGYGASAAVTGAFGFAAAALAIEEILKTAV